MDLKGGFGKDGKLPWSYAEDMKHFRDITTGHACVMGKNTYFDIMTHTNNRMSVLPNRRCYVLSSSLRHLPNATVVRSLTEIPEDEIYVIGGERLYNLALQTATKIHLTTVDHTYDCDRFIDMKYITENFKVSKTVDTVSPDLTIQVLERLHAA